jgi:hypothetical protein
MRHLFSSLYICCLTNDCEYGAEDEAAQEGLSAISISSWPRRTYFTAPGLGGCSSKKCKTIAFSRSPVQRKVAVSARESARSHWSS